MKIITFQGGLGNQMFQYVFYLWLKNSYKTIYGYYPSKGLKGHNGLEIENVFKDIQLPKTNKLISIIVILVKILSKLGVNKISKTNNLNLNNILFEDYWQDIQFNDGFKFQFNENLIFPKNHRLLLEIEEINSIALHIRRGDYLLDKYSNIYGGVCDKEYYNSAIKIIESKVINPIFYIFSDDIEWAVENIKLKNSKYIDWNINNNSFQDLFLMSKCKHNIIANSTFSWWGAYLNYTQGKIVIAPIKWFASKNIEEPNIIPNSWIRI